MRSNLLHPTYTDVLERTLPLQSGEVPLEAVRLNSSRYPANSLNGCATVVDQIATALRLRRIEPRNDVVMDSGHNGSLLA